MKHEYHSDGYGRTVMKYGLARVGQAFIDFLRELTKLTFPLNTTLSTQFDPKKLKSTTYLINYCENRK